MGKAIGLPGYGSGAAATKIKWRGDIFGTSNYQAAGELVTPAQFGMSAIEELIVPSLSYSGNYFARVLYPTNPTNVEQQAAAFQSNFNNSANNVLLAWYAANNTQVANNTNLAAEGIRISVTGI